MGRILLSLLIFVFSCNGRPHDSLSKHFPKHRIPEIKSNYGPGLYGIADKGSGVLDGNSLILINATTGDTSVLVKGDSTYATGENNACLDNVNNIWYYIYVNLDDSSTGLFPYDLNNPSDNSLDIIELPMILSGAFVGVGDYCMGDPNTGDIYFFGGANDGTTNEILIKISRDSSTMNTTVTTIEEYTNLNDELELFGGCNMYDSKRNMIWVPSANGKSGRKDELSWYYLDPTSGKIVNNISESNFPMNTCNYDKQLDAMVGVELNREERDGNISYVLKIADPVTLEITSSFSVLNEWCTWTDVYGYDDQNSIQYQFLYKAENEACEDTNGDDLLPYLIGVSVTTGEIVTEVEFGTDSLDVPWSIQYWDGQ